MRLEDEEVYTLYDTLAEWMVCTNNPKKFEEFSGLKFSEELREQVMAVMKKVLAEAMSREDLRAWAQKEWFRVLKIEKAAEEGGMRSCPGCEELVAPVDKFCSQCGRELAEEGKESEGTESEEDEQERNRRLAKLSDDLDELDRQAAALAEAEREEKALVYGSALEDVEEKGVCPGCKKEVDPEEKFCGWCGAALKEEKEKPGGLEGLIPES